MWIRPKATYLVSQNSNDRVVGNIEWPPSNAGKTQQSQGGQQPLARPLLQWQKVPAAAGINTNSTFLLATNASTHGVSAGLDLDQGCRLNHITRRYYCHLPFAQSMTMRAHFRTERPLDPRSSITFETHSTVEKISGNGTAADLDPHLVNFKLTCPLCGGKCVLVGKKTNRTFEANECPVPVGADVTVVLFKFPIKIPESTTISGARLSMNGTVTLVHPDGNPLLNASSKWTWRMCQGWQLGQESCRA